jgi:DNA-binding NarL/FixJ family response regulator
MAVERPTFLFFSDDARAVINVQDALAIHAIRGHAWLLRSEKQIVEAPRCDVAGFGLAQTQAALAYLRVWREGRPTPVLMFADRFPEAHAFQLLSSGVRGLVTYGQFTHSAAAALEVLVRGGFWIPRAIMTRYFEGAMGTIRRSRLALQRAELDEQDATIVDELLQRSSDEQIAAHTSRGVDAVRADIARLLEFFGVRRREDLLLLAQQQPEAAVTSQSTRATPRVGA